MTVAISRARQVVVPVVLGVLAFFGVTGGRELSPRNIAWLSEGDPASYFIGWHFFRYTPWGFPLGMSPRYGAEVSSAIALTDNIPLCALVFKLVGRWLPEPFQYFGLWTLCCFVLQAWFAWLLVGLFTRIPFVRTCGTALFVFAPPFLWRLQGHYQMESQWLLLAALYICLGPRRLSRGAAWPVLAFTVALIHYYMTAMVLGLWLTDWLRRVLFENRTRAELWQLFAIPSLVLVALWQAGLFTIGKGIVRRGFGIYRMNILSLVDPSGWSYVLPDIPEGKGDYEGFNYLGLGGLLLALFALPALRRALPVLREKRHYWPLLALLSAFTLFAISNRVGFADRTFVIPLSQRWIDRANVLRGCGRMFWPVFYVLFWLLIRTVVRRYPPRIAAAILFTAVTVQALDTSAGWLPIRRDLMTAASSSWTSPLKSAFWSQVPTNYREIRMVPPQYKAPNYSVFAYFAATHGMATDAVFFARVDQEKLRLGKRQALLAVNKGRYTPGVLYVLERRFVKAARRSVNPEFDLLARIDGFVILAPGWKCRPQCTGAVTPDDCSMNCPERASSSPP